MKSNREPLKEVHPRCFVGGRLQTKKTGGTKSILIIQGKVKDGGKGGQWIRSRGAVEVKSTRFGNRLAIGDERRRESQDVRPGF